MLQRRKILTLFAVIALLGGCSANTILPEDPPTLPLLSPADLGEPLLIKQVLTMKWHERHQQLLVVGELRPEQLTLVLLSALGQRLATLRYDGTQLERQSDLPGLELPFDQFLAQMQFSLWPEAALRKHLAQTDGWSLTTSASARIARYRERPIFEVRYEKDHMFLNHQVLDYSVRVETLERKPL